MLNTKREYATLLLLGLLTKFFILCQILPQRRVNLNKMRYYFLLAGPRLLYSLWLFYIAAVLTLTI